MAFMIVIAIGSLLLSPGLAVSVEWVLLPSIYGLVRDECGASLVPYVLYNKSSVPPRSGYRYQFVEGTRLLKDDIVQQQLYLRDLERDTWTRINYPTQLQPMYNELGPLMDGASITSVLPHAVHNGGNSFFTSLNCLDAYSRMDSADIAHNVPEITGEEDIAEPDIRNTSQRSPKSNNLRDQPILEANSSFCALLSQSCIELCQGQNSDSTTGSSTCDIGHNADRTSNMATGKPNDSSFSVEHLESLPDVGAVEAVLIEYHKDRSGTDSISGFQSEDVRNTSESAVSIVAAPHQTGIKAQTTPISLTGSESDDCSQILHVQLEIQGEPEELSSPASSLEKQESSNSEIATSSDSVDCSSPYSAQAASDSDGSDATMPTISNLNQNLPTSVDGFLRCYKEGGEDITIDFMTIIGQIRRNAEVAARKDFGTLKRCVQQNSKTIISDWIPKMLRTGLYDWPLIAEQCNLKGSVMDSEMRRLSDSIQQEAATRLESITTLSEKKLRSAKSVIRNTVLDTIGQIGKSALLKFQDECKSALVTFSVSLPQLSWEQLDQPNQPDCYCMDEISVEKMPSNPESVCERSSSDGEISQTLTLISSKLSQTPSMNSSTVFNSNSNAIDPTPTQMQSPISQSKKQLKKKRSKQKSAQDVVSSTTNQNPKLDLPTDQISTGFTNTPLACDDTELGEDECSRNIEANQTDLEGHGNRHSRPIVILNSGQYSLMCELMHIFASSIDLLAESCGPFIQELDSKFPDLYEDVSECERLTSKMRASSHIISKVVATVRSVLIPFSILCQKELCALVVLQYPIVRDVTSDSSYMDKLTGTVVNALLRIVKRFMFEITFHTYNQFNSLAESAHEKKEACSDAARSAIASETFRILPELFAQAAPVLRRMLSNVCQSIPDTLPQLCDAVRERFSATLQDIVEIDEIPEEITFYPHDPIHVGSISQLTNMDISRLKAVHYNLQASLVTFKVDNTKLQFTVHAEKQSALDGDLSEHGVRTLYRECLTALLNQNYGYLHECIQAATVSIAESVVGVLRRYVRDKVRDELNGSNTDIFTGQILAVCNEVVCDYVRTLKLLAADYSEIPGSSVVVKQMLQACRIARKFPSELIPQEKDARRMLREMSVHPKELIAGFLRGLQSGLLLKYYMLFMLTEELPDPVAALLAKHIERLYKSQSSWLEEGLRYDRAFPNPKKLESILAAATPGL